MPRKRPSALRADAALARPETAPILRPRVRGPRLSGSARAAVLRYERASYHRRGSVLVALDAWQHATGVDAPRITCCGIWLCCGYDETTAETRDVLDDLLRNLDGRPARELRRLVRAGDRRIAGDVDGPWWRDPLRWRE